MLTLDEITKQYPAHIHAFKRGMLREYLQYKILESVFRSEYGEKLSFLGGTALRLIYGNERFSEDIDFDNFELSFEEFNALTMVVKRSLELEGYAVEIRSVHKNAYRCYIRLPDVLFDNKLSALKEEKILIQIDSLSHGFFYAPDKKILDAFGVFGEINVTPIDILLSQKIYAIFQRETKKGRDFFDTTFLLAKTKPNYDYLQEKLGIKTPQELRQRLLDLCGKLDFDALARDVEKFLFFPKDVRRIQLFEKYIRNVKL